MVDFTSIKQFSYMQIYKGVHLSGLNVYNFSYKFATVAPFAQFKDTVSAYLVLHFVITRIHIYAIDEK